MPPIATATSSVRISSLSDALLTSVDHNVCRLSLLKCIDLRGERHDAQVELLDGALHAHECVEDIHLREKEMANEGIKVLHLRPRSRRNAVLGHSHHVVTESHTVRHLRYNRQRPELRRELLVGLDSHDAFSFGCFGDPRRARVAYLKVPLDNASEGQKYPPGDDTAYIRLANGSDVVLPYNGPGVPLVAWAASTQPGAVAVCRPAATAPSNRGVGCQGKVRVSGHRDWRGEPGCISVTLLRQKSSP
jgi:hypothetical protein